MPFESLIRSFQRLLRPFEHLNNLLLLSPCLIYVCNIGNLRGECVLVSPEPVSIPLTLLDLCLQLTDSPGDLLVLVHLLPPQLLSLLEFLAQVTQAREVLGVV